MTLDIKAVRADTAGCDTVAHFNHSGASLPSRKTVAAIVGHLGREAVHGPMEAAVGAMVAIETARSDAAALLGAAVGEMAFATSGSSAWGLTFAALPALNPGDRILVGRQEWGGNLSTLQSAAARAGASIEVIACREDGSVDVDAFAAMIDDRVRLVSLTWLPANGGLINDAAGIGRIARAAAIPYFVDAGQALGQIPVDVAEIGCDVLKGAGRKFLRGPRGTALLYVRQSFLERLAPVYRDVMSAPFGAGGFELRDDARRFETSEVSPALLLGLAQSLSEARAIGLNTIQCRISELAAGLRARLGDLPGVTLQDLGTQRSGLVSFTLDSMPATQVRARLANVDINVGANGIPYTPLDMRARGLTEVVRASISYFNTEDEIDQLTAAISTLVRESSVAH